MDEVTKASKVTALLKNKSSEGEDHKQSLP